MLQYWHDSIAKRLLKVRYSDCLGSKVFRSQSNDAIEVRGSRITFDGQPILIAAEVKKGDQVLTWRDDAGIPVWAGWRRQR
ncbi:hypothetical protein [Leptothermofonsia sp. ETS-13]|uniref:hypothetical protein n=1 Tax=Leptothermofonsia sp. ETS-13 TaxID=3035696 RepID=UPI003BA1AF06